MHIEAPKNKNYSAVVVELNTFADLAGCDNVKAAIIFGSSVIVSKDTQPGAVGLFFPVETALSKEFLSHNNLFRKPEYGNADLDKKGYFEDHGRVKCTKFRGHKSEGFWIPLESLSYLGEPLDLPVGAEFDQLLGKEICRKYIPVSSLRSAGQGKGSGKQGRLARAEDKIVDGQFRFHVDTDNLRRNAHKIKVGDLISITDKWHGTSIVLARVLVKRGLNWVERCLRRLGVNIQDQEYGYVWSSRRVVKGVDDPKDTAVHFYGSDIWGAVAKKVNPCLPKGISLYGEVVGYTEDGKPIQPGYTYGCQPGTWLLLVYRITSTNVDGIVTEFTWPQIQAFCEDAGLETVPLLYYGYVDQLSPEVADDLTGALVQHLETAYVRGQTCPYNPGKVPAEGIVVRVEGRVAEPYKLKSFAFLKRESDQIDTGEADVETLESEAMA